jgi:VanZ family protein
MSRVSGRRWWLLAALYMAGLFALSSIPDRKTDTGIEEYFPPPGVQNALHVPAYAGLSFLMWRGLSGRRRAALLAALLATAYGVTDELHQMFVPGRMASVTDGLANALGAFAVAGWAALRRPTRPAAPPR